MDGWALMKNRLLLALFATSLMACPDNSEPESKPLTTGGGGTIPGPVAPVETGEKPCLEALQRDPASRLCVVSPGESVAASDGYFRLDHPWLAQARHSGESVRFILADALPGGDGRQEAPFGDWDGALSGLQAGDHVTFVLGRGTLVGSAVFTGLGRVTLLGNSASVTTMTAVDEPVLVANETDWLRAWGLRLERSGAEMGPAVNVEKVDRVHMSQVRVASSSGDGIQATAVGTDGFILGYSTFEAVAGAALHSVEGLGWWTVDGTTFQGPVGTDGISVVDFGGSQFRVFGSEFAGGIGADGISVVDFGGSQFRVGENQFAGPIGGDGISVVDFGGSQFRSHDNVFQGPLGGDGISVVDFGGSQFRSQDNIFQEMAGSGVFSSGGQGTYLMHNDRMEGPIGRDGITIQGFQGQSVTLQQIHVGEVSRVGISGVESLGSWTVDGATFQGPIGFDGISLQSVGQEDARVKITGIDGESIGRFGMRLLDGLGWWTVDGTTFRGTGGPGVVAKGFTAGNQLDFGHVDVTGAQSMGMVFDSNGASVEVTDAEIAQTVGVEQGGPDDPGPALGYGVLVMDSAHLKITKSQLIQNAGSGLLIDLRGWDARRDRPDLSGEAVIRLDDVVVENPPNAREDQPKAQAQHVPEGVEVIGMGEGRGDGEELDAQELPTPTGPDQAGCGDGIVDAELEQCDDGNQVDEDACTNECKGNVCGDGLLHRGVEECDDGNNINAGDGCSNRCFAADEIPFDGGVFNMGNVGVDERPYNVRVAPFRLSRTEVTCGEYNDYLSQAGPSFDLVKDGLIEEGNAGPHLWNVFSGGSWDAPQNCVEPTGWPHGIHNAQDEAEQHYQRGIGTPIVSDPLDFRAADQLPLDTGARGETNPYPHYYFVRRYSTGGHVLSGAYLDIYHPNAAVAVFVAGRLIYSSGMVDGNECSSDLTEIPAEGATRVLLKPADLARINTYYRYTQHVAVMLRPLRADVESVGFAMRFRAWKRDVAADVPRPWKRGVDHVQSDAGQAICGESDFPVAVDWDRAREYCRWHGGDLPTAAQWEFAARSGGQDIVHPWGNRPRARNIPRHEDLVVCDYANVAADNGRSTCPNPGVRHSVCSFPLGNSDQGVCDLIGNLAEWTLDGRGNVPAGGEGDDRPQHTPQFWDEFADFQLRGGSMMFDDGAHALQAAYRHRDGWIIEDQEAFYDYGFRCAWPNE